ncbi:MAG: hypothetical protein A2508_02320 [Candidatus Lambdaproteobacteria bacterium RIFOXYD12_FULL_49_8]|uniref:LSM domain-containing protein n=1 Tax=Candidatus Lambdaproteobacteria bacterium RIFOXYD2_FULL_50_16 TaxID=1817772 RepID=A0A1F6GA70_9PROT|nr:MAG: hypothetical protein A2527_06550 [Candidatus Lambdaproteobacteria bacterium RIFOXYD2_FULL_50_16]OGG98051.1 MAG: hypothetical protein A2508_02320 [Candidatus Lambdaproteobacteria bacterium RIFOXYD12_FULL_49_8]
MGLIETVNLSSQGSLTQKLAPLVGSRTVRIKISGGQELRGILSEVGADYLALLNDAEEERLIPFSALLFIQID